MARPAPKLFIATALAAALVSSVAAMPGTSAASTCSLSAELVPSCGVMLGAYATSFGGSNVDQQFTNFNAKSGTKLSVGHDYRGPGQTLSGGDVELAKTKDALLLVNWKPVSTWASADGGNSTVNAQIDAMAKSVKALGTTKIIMTIYHEAENDASGGAPGCPNNIYKGSAGTPAQYRGMWTNVESRFSALGVTNVVWAITFVGYQTWNCMIGSMWPGNSLIDWVLYDPYMTNKRDFANSVGSFYDTLTSQSDAAHNYLSKPWGLAEFGDLNTSVAVQNTFYTQITQALNTNEFPKLKLLTIYDAIGHLGDSRVDYNEAGVKDSTELANFDTLGQDTQIVQGRASVAGG